MADIAAKPEKEVDAKTLGHFTCFGLLYGGIFGFLFGGLAGELIAVTLFQTIHWTYPADKIAKLLNHDIPRAALVQLPIAFAILSGVGGALCGVFIDFARERQWHRDYSRFEFHVKLWAILSSIAAYVFFAELYFLLMDFELFSWGKSHQLQEAESRVRLLIGIVALLGGGGLSGYLWSQCVLALAVDHEPEFDTAAQKVVGG